MKGGLSRSENAPVLPVKELLSILSKVMEAESLDTFLRDIARITADTFNMKAVTVGALNEETNLFEVRATWGFPDEMVPRLLEYAFSYERMKYDLREEFKIGPRTYYVRPYETGIRHDDDAEYLLDQSKVDHPRSSPDEWQELDYIDFVLTDQQGKWIGWLELNDPGDGKVPSPEVIERIQVFSDLAALAIENAMIHKRTLDSATYSAVKEMANRLLEITQIVLSHKGEGLLLEAIADAMIDLFPITRLAIYRTDSSGTFIAKVVRGYPAAQAERILGIGYSPAQWKETLRISDKIGSLSHFALGEHVVLEEMDGAFYEEVPKKIPPRKKPDDWHVLDFIDTILFDKNGKEMGCLEILETGTKKKLPPIMIAQIEMFASIASIAIEMLNIWEDGEKLTRANATRAKVLARMFELTERIVAMRDREKLLNAATEFLRTELGFKSACTAVWSPREGCFRYLPGDGVRCPDTVLPRKELLSDLDPTHEFTENLYWIPMKELTQERIDVSHLSIEERNQISSLKESSASDMNEPNIFDFFVIPLRERGDQIVSVIFATNRTENKIFEKDLLELLATFSATVSLAFKNSELIQEIFYDKENLDMLNRLLFHDISNFNLLIGFYSEFAGNIKLPEEQRADATGKVKVQLSLSNELIARIRKLTFIREKGSEKMLTVDIVSTLQSLAREVKESRLDKKIQITVRSDEQQCLVRANELIHDLFQNLLSNSIKYDQKDTIAIEIEIMKHFDGTRYWWETIIEDHGVGIPDNMKDMIFQKFSPRISGGTGIGLGLSIVKSIVQQYGGRIWVEDRVKGNQAAGAAFHVLLPMA